MSASMSLPLPSLFNNKPLANIIFKIVKNDQQKKSAFLSFFLISCNKNICINVHLLLYQG